MACIAALRAALHSFRGSVPMEGAEGVRVLMQREGYVVVLHDFVMNAFDDDDDGLEANASCEVSMRDVINKIVMRK